MDEVVEVVVVVVVVVVAVVVVVVVNMLQIPPISGTWPKLEQSKNGKPAKQKLKVVKNYRQC